MKTQLILVGGFLGAGKTTLLLRAARMLTEQGHRVGLVTNDQGIDLVDTALATSQAVPVTEVAGGCFCCRFPDLAVALEQLQKTVDPDVILAEPVGSCTDLIATVVRPLTRYYGEIFEVAPFTVLHDPLRDPEEFPATVRYLHHQQLAEAEIVGLNKVDLLATDAIDAQVAALRTMGSGAQILTFSARTGAGVQAWLSQVRSTASRADRTLTIDYGQYAEAEAQLGWLNARGVLQADLPFSLRAWVNDLLQHLDNDFTTQAMPIAHVKLHVTGRAATLKASLTGDGATSWDADTDDVTDRAHFILNVRVNALPNQLEQTVRQALAQQTAHLRYDLTHFECFSPRPPQPTYRL